MWLPILWWLGLNPGLFTPVLLLAVVMMEKAGKTCHLQWHTFVGCVEEWHIPGKITIKWVCYRSQTRTMEGLSTWHQAVLAMFLGFRKQKELEGDQESEWWTGTGEMQESPLISSSRERQAGCNGWARLWDVTFGSCTQLLSKVLKCAAVRHAHPMSRYCTWWVYKAFPCINTASNNHWAGRDKKTWVQGQDKVTIPTNLLLWELFPGLDCLQWHCWDHVEIWLLQEDTIEQESLCIRIRRY